MIILYGDSISKALVTDKDINDRWESYFYKLFNDGGGGSHCDWADLTTRKGDLNLSFYRKIWVSEVKEAVKKIENGKAIGKQNYLMRFYNPRKVGWVEKKYFDPYL